MRKQFTRYKNYLSGAVAIMLLCVAKAQAQQPTIPLVIESDETTAAPLPLLKSSFKVNSQSFAFQDAWVKNPALRFKIIDFSNTSFGLSRISDKADDYIVEQKGRNDQGYGFSSRSFQKMSDRVRVWGDAQYYNGTRNVLRSLTSDYDRVYPYLTGDTLNEKKWNTETYALAGGYAQDEGAYIWGLEASMRTMQEYGLRDPRARNRVIDFHLSMGMAWKLPSKYLLALAAKGGAYKQSQTISFLSDETQRNPLANAIFNYTGLGTTAFGNQNSWSYEINSIEGDLSIYPAAQKGWLATAKYEFSQLRKLYPGESTASEFAVMGTDTYHFNVGWMDNQANNAWALTAGYHRKNSVGEEMLIGADRTISTQPSINAGRIAAYANEVDTYSLNAFFERRGRFTWSIAPQLGYAKNNSRYLHPERSLSYERMQYRLDARLHRIIKKHYLQLQIIGVYDQHVASAMDLSNRLYVTQPNTTIPAYDKPINDIEYRNYRFISTDNAQLEASLRWEYQVFANKSVYLQPSVRKGWYTQQTETNFYQLKLGLVL